MPRLSRILIIGGAVVVLGFVILILARPAFKPAEGPSSVAPPREEAAPTAGRPPANAFLPAPQLPSQNQGFLVTQPSGGEKLAQPQFQGPILSFDDLKKRVALSVAPSQQPPKTELLQLPNVPDGELNIGADGVSSTEQYLVYVATNSDNIIFERKKLLPVLKDENGVFLTAPRLVESELKDGASPDLQRSLLVQREFLAAKISFLKSIKIFGEAVALNKKMIGANELTISLIDSGFGLINTIVQKQQLQKTYGDYLALISREHEKLLNGLQLLSLEKELGIFGKLTESLGILKIALAFTSVTPVSIPLGGPVLAMVPCIDAPGAFMVTIGPPVPPIIGVPPGTLFVSPDFIADPLMFYPFKGLHPGAIWLGLYMSIQFPCELFSSSPKVLITGTSP